MNRERKKPYKNYTWFVLIVLLIVAFVILKSLYEENTHFSGNESYYFIFGTIIGGFLGYSIIYQLGKLVFGLLSGMKFVSISLLIFNIAKVQGETKFSVGAPEGWLGNTHMIPGNENYDKVKPILYHFGGLFAYIIAAIGSSLICLALDSTRKLLFVALVCAVIGLLVILLNLMPLYSDGLNDGFTIRLLLEKENKKPYLDNLLQYNALHYGNGSLKEDYNYERYDDAFQAASLLYKYYFYMENKEHRNAEKICDMMIDYKDYLSFEAKQIAYNGKLYFMLLRETDEVCYDYFYSIDKDFRKFPVSKDSLEGIKTGLLIASKVEKSYDLYEYLVNAYPKLVDSYYPTKVKREMELIEKSLNIVAEQHPDWVSDDILEEE